MTSPFRDYFFQNAQNGLTNPNNILTMYLPISPAIAGIVWLCLMIVTLLWFVKKPTRI